MTPALQFELQRLHEQAQDHLLSAEAVLRFAEKNKKSAIAGELTWDDKIAGRLYRLDEVRCLIQKYATYTLTVGPAQGRTMRGTLSLMGDRANEGGGYRRVEDVAGNARLLAECERTARLELEAWCSRYEILQSLVAQVRGIVSALGAKDVA